MCSPKRHGRDADVARRAILNAAEAIFASAGFAGARVDAIAAASGYNKSLLFQYFGDKLGLYRAIVCGKEEQIEGGLGDLIATLPPEDERPLDAARVRATLAAIVRWLFEFYRARPRLLRIFAWEAAEGWQTLAQTGTPLPAQCWRDPLLAFLRRAQSERLLRVEVDPPLLLAQIHNLAVMHLLAIPRFAHIFAPLDFASEQALDHAREQIVDLVLNGATPVQVPSQQPSQSPSQEVSPYASGV